jgi:hypothetical protein
MKSFRFALSALVLTVLLDLPSAVLACPSCQEAPAAAGTGPDDEGSGTPLAYNHSIYLMVAVPYTSMAVISLLIYRGMKKNEEFRRVYGLGDGSASASPSLDGDAVGPS